MSAFNPYLDLAIGNEHKNVQVIKMLSSIEDIGKNFRIVLLFEDVAPKSRGSCLFETLCSPLKEKLSLEV